MLRYISTGVSCSTIGTTTTSSSTTTTRCGSIVIKNCSRRSYVSGVNPFRTVGDELNEILMNNNHHYHRNTNHHSRQQQHLKTTINNSSNPNFHLNLLRGDKRSTTSDSDGSGSSSNSSSSSGSGDNNNKGGGIVKLPFGESAPRLPNLKALPLISRPLFPGLIANVTITDPKTIDAMEKIYQQDQSYLACFLRSKDTLGSTSAGLLLPHPEVITSPDDLFNVGTLVQIQHFSKTPFPPRPNDFDQTQLETNDQEDNGTDETISAFESPKSSSKLDTIRPAANLLLLAHRRIDLLSVDNVGPPIDVTVRHWDRLEYSNNNNTTTKTTIGSGGDYDASNNITDSNVRYNNQIRALTNEIIMIIRELAQKNKLFSENLSSYPIRVDANDPYRLADFAASLALSNKAEDLQQVLQAIHPEERLQLALSLLSRERDIMKIQNEIASYTTATTNEATRKFYLSTQLKYIKKELGIAKDDIDVIVEKYRAKLKEYTEIPEEALEVIENEITRLSSMEKQSSEFNLVRNYLDWLVAIPWNVTTTENYDLRNAKMILDQDHYGLDDVKDTILQFIAVGKLQGGTLRGKILCLAGPPGTGKTSIAQSIANALGRKFYRFSVGGLSDDAEIKGHRRTYLGAMPGKVIQCLKTAGAINAVCLIDEIDKLGKGHRGDPASALLEVLDPSQNSTFRDHFLDVPVDISQVLFICTANDLGRIPGPLRDRLEIIKLSGYDFPEKVAIAEQYLVPKSLKDNGLMYDPIEREKKQQEAEQKKQGIKPKKETKDTSSNEPSTDDKKTIAKTPLDQYIHNEGVPESLRITSNAIQSLVRWYAREAGVRSLAKYIDRITRKLALQVVAEKEGTPLPEKTARKSDSWVISNDNLVDYVGKAVFTSDRLYDTGPLPCGIVMGLAYTSMGGTALYIETQGIQRGIVDDSKSKGGDKRGSLKTTGQLGDVMKESAQIAYTVARARVAQLDPTRSHYFDETSIHMHVPEGATPKDGPSAGVTMVTSLLSLALNKPVRNDVSMTGEISLTGKVLAVGGIKEKIMAARRAGITQVILPEANRRDVDEIPEYLKDGLVVHYADSYEQVYDVAFSSQE